MFDSLPTVYLFVAPFHPGSGREYSVENMTYKKAVVQASTFLVSWILFPEIKV